MTPKERKEQAIRRQQELINTARADGNRSLTQEEQTEFERLQREIEQADAEIQAQERGLSGNTGATNAPPVQNTTDSEGQRAAAIEAERQRTAEIMSLCRDFNQDPDEYIRNGSTVEQVRAAILEGLRQNNAPVGARATVTEDEQDRFRAAASDALLMRSGIPVQTPANGASELRSMSLRDLAIDCLAREGQNIQSLLRMGGDELYDTLTRQFYNPTAAFPAILDNTIRKSIVELYNQVPTTFQAWTTSGTLTDFKETKDHEYLIGGLSDFELVPENGEIKPDIPETKLLPTRKLDTYGKSFSMTRQAFINDDIGFLSRVPGLYAAKAKKTIDKQVYSILFNNAKIYDGVNLFDNKHNNLVTTGEKPSQMAIQAMILQMQKQKDPFGEPIYMTPQHIIVPVGYEFDLAVILRSAQVTGSANNDINPLYNYPLNIVQTPVLNALAGTNAVPWFMVANQMSAKSIQVDYLNGVQTPTVRRMESPGTLGFVWDIYFDWGISVRDFRGMIKNPGVAIK